MSIRTCATFCLVCAAMNVAGVFAAEPAGVPTEPVGTTQAAAKASYQNKRICRMESVAGSHIKQQVCRTQAEIDAQRRDAQGSLSTLDTAKGGINDGKGG